MIEQGVKYSKQIVHAKSTFAVTIASQQLLAADPTRVGWSIALSGFAAGWVNIGGGASAVLHQGEYVFVQQQWSKYFGVDWYGDLVTGVVNIIGSQAGNVSICTYRIVNLE